MRQNKTDTVILDKLAEVVSDWFMFNEWVRQAKKANNATDVEKFMEWRDHEAIKEVMLVGLFTDAHSNEVEKAEQLIRVAKEKGYELYEKRIEAQKRMKELLAENQ